AQTSRRTVPSRHREKIAARDYNGALPIRREVYRFEMVGCVDQPAVATVEIFLDCDRHRRGLTCGKIVAPNVSGLLKYDRVFADGWKLDIEIGEVCELLGFFRCEINNEQV